MIVLFMFVLCRTEISEAAKPRFFIKASANNTEAQGGIRFFESEVFNNLQKEFPCVVINSMSSVLAQLEHERMRQFLSTDESSLENIGAAMGCDYLVSLKIEILGNNVLINAFCADTRTSKVISRANATTANVNAAVKEIQSVSKELIEGLKKFEICPFKGPITVEVKTERNDKQTETYPVSCNGRDGIYRKVTDISKTSDVNWKLNKTGKNMTAGSVAFTLFEETNVEEQNDCYKCSSGREGPRMYTEKNINRANVQGLSDESVSEGQQIQDARAEIIFNEDGTYMLMVKAASKKGDLKLKSERKAEGTCDNKTDPPENITKKADVPLNEIFGPFRGTSLDKNLSEQKTITREDPLTKEKTTITYNFNLSRE